MATIVKKNIVVLYLPKDCLEKKNESFLSLVIACCSFYHGLEYDLMFRASYSVPLFKFRICCGVYSGIFK